MSGIAEALEADSNPARAVWITGRYTRWWSNGWTLIGVFSTEQAAIAACTDGRCFVGPAVVDLDLGPEDRTWPGCYFPFGVHTS